jgi:hypothetical protein
MTKQEEIVLSAMAAGKDATHSPVQIQKLLLLFIGKIAGVAQW